MDAALIAAGVVFLAELGDKSQLVAATLGSRRFGWPLAAAILLNALVATAVSATIGGFLHDRVPADLRSLVAGLVFVGFALVGLRAWRTSEPSAEAAPTGSRASSIATLTATLSLAELGDRTMFATGGLAAELGPWAAGIGGFAGMASAGLVGAWFGSRLAARLRPNVVSLLGAVVFLIVGLWLLAGLV